MIVCHLVGHSVPYVAHHHGGHGEIGKHTRLKILRLNKPSQFKSGCPHHFPQES